MKQFLILTFIFFIAISTYAQSPQTFNYQGVARDLTGNPMADQDIGLRFAILTESASGTEVYMETHSITTNSLGLFNIKIGSGTPVNGMMSDVNWVSRYKPIVECSLCATCC